MSLRLRTLLLSGGTLLLLTGCGDVAGPDRGSPYRLWIGETGVVLEVGETMILTARMQEKGSSQVQSGSTIEAVTSARWWTDTPVVLRVVNESEGAIEAIGPGRATVWVQVGSRRDSASVTVIGDGDEPRHRWKDVATYGGGTCALDVQGQAYCWGEDFWGGWGTGGERRQWTHAHRPVRVNTSLTFEEIGRGLGFACARTGGGEVWCWGQHLGSHLGHGRTTVDYETAPVRVDFPGRATALGVGAMHACLLDEGNRAHCWGNNMNYQLGVAQDILSSADQGGRPLPVAFDGTFEELAVGSFSSCGITAAREIYCWGVTEGGSSSMDERTRVPSRIATSQRPRMVSPNEGGCFLSESGEVHCWGLMRLTPTGRYRLPTAAVIDVRFERLMGPCGLGFDGSAWCWGSAAFSILDPSAATEPCGLPSTNRCSSTPIPVPGGHRLRPSA
jgi:hypothetical protein